MSPPVFHDLVTLIHHLHTCADDRRRAAVVWMHDVAWVADGHVRRISVFSRFIIDRDAVSRRGTGGAGVQQSVRQLS